MARVPDMPVQTHLLTACEFLEWPDEPGSRQALIRGMVATLSLGCALHGEIGAEIGRMIGDHVNDSRLGTCYAAGTGCIVERDPDTIIGADFSFVGNERLALIAERQKYIPFGADLIVEVRSPGDRDHEVEEKIQLWLSAGSLLVWDVDPETRTVVVHRPVAEPVTLGEDQEIDGGDVIPGFRCRVAEFFA
jgi:Uma2 family endonuclease